MYRWCSSCADKMGNLPPGQDYCPKCNRETEVEFDPAHNDSLRIDERREFKIIKKLSKHTDAGMSAVYLVERTDNPERRAVLKIAKAKKLINLKREIKHLQNLEHPNIIRLAYGQNKRNIDDAILTDVKDGQKLYFIALEYMDGGSLKDRLAGGNNIPPQELAQVIGQIADALDCTHSQGVIHLDVKPANILLSSNGRAVLSDFGVTRDAAVLEKMSGVSIGTPIYSAPEELRKDTNLDHRVDIYALGLVTYEALAGQNPIVLDSVSGGTSTLTRNVLVAIDNIPKPRKLKSSISGNVERVLMKATAFDRDERYSSASIFARDFEQAVEQSRSKRQPLLLGVGLLALILVVAVLAGSAFLYWPPVPQPTATVGANAPDTSDASNSSVELGGSNASASLGVNGKVSGHSEKPEPAPETGSSPFAAPSENSEDTPKPTSTVADIFTPTRTSPTPKPSKGDSASSRTNTESTEPPDGNITLMAPRNGTVIPHGAKLQTFRWKWNGGCEPLPAGYHFEVRIWHHSDGPRGAMDAKNEAPQCDPGNNSYFFEIGDLYAAPGLDGYQTGEFRWDVAIVQVTPYQALLSPVPYVLSLGSPGGDSGGGGGNGSSSPGIN